MKIKGILIDAHNKTITEIQVENSFTDPGGMYEFLKTDIIEHAHYFPNKDVLLVDEEGTFKVGYPYFFIGDNPLLGNGLIVGSKGSNYADCKTSLEEIQKIISFT